MCESQEVTGEKCYAYCRCEDMSILNRYPFYFKIEITERLKRHGIFSEAPLFVILCEKETYVKICTDNRTYGICAEYAYCYQKFPLGTERISQWYGEKDIEGKKTKVDVLVLKLPDETEREVTFDISDFKNEFEGFAEELKKRENEKMNTNTYKCSICGGKFVSYAKFCPSCGSKYPE